MTRLSCHRFRSNEVRLWLRVFAYNLGKLWQRLVNAGGWLVKHATITGCCWPRGI
jgi:hypothetical protein